MKSNQKVPEVLKNFTASFPPSPNEQSPWTLDTLFLLPKGRLRYYRRLYNRLLKGTVAGKNDHRLLTSALEKLDALLDILESRQSIKVGGSSQQGSPRLETEDEVVIDLRTQSILDAIENPRELVSNPAVNQDDISSGRGMPRRSVSVLIEPFNNLGLTAHLMTYHHHPIQNWPLHQGCQ